MKLIITLLLVIVGLLGCNKAEQEVVIIPNKFIGRVLIVYDQPNGAIPIYKDGKRVYKIPSNGILKTQFSANPGWMSLPEFYYDKVATENRLIYKLTNKNLPIDSTVAYGGTAGSVKSNKGHQLKFLEYYVGNKNQIDSAYQAAQTLDINKFIQ